LKVEVRKLNLSKRKLKIGDSFEFSFEAQLLEKKPHDVRLEYKIYFMKANGKQSGKIFQIGTYQTQPQQTLSIRKTHSFANLTTRKHHAGFHRLVIVVNGKELSDVEFLLQE
jgi:hypothetical protein